MDVNPYSPIGIDEDTAGFWKSWRCIAYYRTAQIYSIREQEQIEQNQAEVVNRGRAPNAAIAVGEQSIPIEAWSQSHLEAMQDLGCISRSAL